IFIWYGFYILKLPLKFTGNMNIGAGEGDPPVFSLGSLLFYPLGIAGQVNFFFFILFISGMFLYFKNFKTRDHNILYWGLSGILFFTLLRNKDLRFTLGILPFIAIISSEVISTLRSGLKNYFKVLLLLLMLSSFFLSQYTNFKLVIETQSFPISIFLSSPPRPRRYSIDRIINVITAELGNDAPVPLTDNRVNKKYYGYSVLFNNPRINTTTFELEMERRGIPLYSVKSRNYYFLKDIILLKDNSGRGRYLTKHQSFCIDQIEKDEENFSKYYHEFGRIPISDREYIKLYAVNYLTCSFSPTFEDKMKKIEFELKNYLMESFELSGSPDFHFTDFKDCGDFTSLDLYVGFRIPIPGLSVENTDTSEVFREIRIKNIILKLFPGEYIKVDDLILFTDVSDTGCSSIKIFTFNEVEICSKLSLDFNELITDILDKSKVFDTIKFETELSGVFERSFKITFGLKVFPFLTELRFRIYQDSPDFPYNYPDSIKLSVTSLRFGKIFRFPVYPLQGIAYKNYNLMPFEKNPYSIKFRLEGLINE
ncbi:MAG TPA: hypothetical protein ENN73_02700, partial [Firmicutes bacterium]|nr:hypothetical protein [Bacillota bacterium]